MTAVLFEYSEDEETKQIMFDCYNAIRLVAHTRRRQAIAQLENRQYRQYSLGCEYKEFTFHVEQTYENLAKIDQLKALRVKIKLYYKYNRYPLVYSVVQVDPNYSISLAAGHLAPGVIQIRFIETPAS